MLLKPVDRRAYTGPSGRTGSFVFASPLIRSQIECFVSFFFVEVVRNVAFSQEVAVARAHVVGNEAQEIQLN
jgi:hypothetical protein